MTEQLNLKGHQRKYLRGLAHALRPVVLIGQKGVSPSVVEALDAALAKHELVKVKFVEDKEKESKRQIASRLEHVTQSNLVGHIGHTVIFYRPHPEPGQRQIVLPPARSAGNG